MYATNWSQLFLIIAATCALPSLVVGYVGVLRPALARGRERQFEDGGKEYGARIIRD
jgi:hypothetical protein